MYKIDITKFDVMGVWIISSASDIQNVIVPRYENQISNATHRLSAACTYALNIDNSQFKASKEVRKNLEDKIKLANEIRKHVSFKNLVNNKSKIKEITIKL